MALINRGNSYDLQLIRRGYSATGRNTHGKDLRWNGVMLSMGRKAAIPLGIALMLGVTVIRADEDDLLAMQSATRVAVGTCAMCHGPGGNPVTPQFPALAGQRAEYLVAQLKAFRSHSRRDPDALAYMWGMAAALDDDTIDALGRYYQAQKPRTQKPEPGRTADPTLLVNGERIYTEGVASRNLSACASCHGQNAEGMGQTPRLAGQHAAYTMKQLRSYQTGLRNTPIMRGITKSMDIDEMHAVAAYLQSLG